MPSLLSMLARCRSTVLTLMTSRSAISLEECPSAISLTISSSRGVRMLSGSPLALPVALQVVADQRGDRARVEERLAAHRRPARLDQVPVGDRLEHVAAGARLERLEEVLLVVVHRQHQDPDAGRAPGDLAGGLQPGHPRHRDVEDGQVDARWSAQARRPRRRRPPRPPPSGRARRPGSAGPAAHQRVVVGEQDAGRGAALDQSRFGPDRDGQAHLGAAARRVVDGAGAAPMSSARSRMPRMPAPSWIGTAPAPSSAMRSSTRVPAARAASARRGRRAACRAMLVRLSWATR